MLTLNQMTPALSTIDDTLKVLALVGDRDATIALLTQLKDLVRQKASIEEERRQADLAIVKVTELKQKLEVMEAAVLKNFDTLKLRTEQFNMAVSAANRRERELKQREDALVAAKTEFEAECIAQKHALAQKQVELEAVSQQAKEVKDKYEAKLAALKTLTA